MSEGSGSVAAAADPGNCGSVAGAVKPVVDLHRCEGKADCVLLARAMLRDAYFPLHAAQELGVKLPWPVQYLRAAPDGTPKRQSRGD